MIKADKIISFINRNGIKYAKKIVRYKSIIVKLHTSPKTYAQLNQHNLFNYAINTREGLIQFIVICNDLVPLLRLLLSSA